MNTFRETEKEKETKIYISVYILLFLCKFIFVEGRRERGIDLQIYRSYQHLYLWEGGRDGGRET